MTSNINQKTIPQGPREDLGQMKKHAKFEPHALTNSMENSPP